MADYTKQVNTDIQFKDKSTNSPTSYYWDFGDGTSPITTESKTVTHKYTSIGTYNITHKATNAQGTGECNVRTIEITPTGRKPPCDSYGDINNDGYITTADVGFVVYHVLYGSPLTDEQKIRADVNDDGIITIEDAFMIQDYVNNIISTFPICKKVPPKLRINTAIIAGAGLGIAYLLMKKK